VVRGLFAVFLFGKALEWRLHSRFWQMAETGFDPEFVPKPMVQAEHICGAPCVFALKTVSWRFAF
jgi:hypothetical protein